MSKDVSFREDIFPFNEKNYEDNGEDDLFLINFIPNEGMNSINLEVEFQNSPIAEQDTTAESSLDATHLEENMNNSGRDDIILELEMPN